ncbi:MAG: TonB-dependent receptor plug domain-containing protein [Bacteroidales bacterium]|nr:TonB-dependent receptor plug domain-containing protein [Bacteroidales bacterium]
MQLQQVEVVAAHNQNANILSIQKIDQAILKVNKISTIANLLQQNSIVFIKDYGPGSLATASFRGTTANHTQVLWNGVPVNAPNNGQVDFNRLPVFFVDEAQLARGAHSASQQGGFGVLVMLNNQSVFKEGYQLDLKQAVGSFQSLGSYADFSWSNRKIQLRTRVFRTSSKNDFEYLNTAPIPARIMKQQQADFVDKGFLQEFHWQKGQSILSFYSWHQWNDRNLPPIMTNLERGGNPEERQDDRFHRNILSYKSYWPKASLEFKAAWFAEYQNYFLRTTSNYGNYETVSLIDSENNIQFWQQEINFRQEFGNHWTLETATSISRQTAASTYYENKKRRDQLALKLKMIYQDERGHLLEIGAHQDDTDGRLMIFSPFAHFSADIPGTERWRYALGISRNYHAPSLNDLYWYPGGNANLLTEKALQADFSLRHKITRESFQIATSAGVYASHISDWIQWRPTAYRYWIPENVSRVFARGAELFLKAGFSHGKLKHMLQLNYAFTRTTDESPLAQYDNTQGRQLIYIPMHHANAHYQLYFKKWQFTYTVVYTGERNTSLNENEFYGFALPAYTLHHCSLLKTWRHLSASFQMNNIFDKDYQAIRWRAMPGRNFAISLSYHFNSNH